MRDKRLNATFDYNTYMRNYMRARSARGDRASGKGRRRADVMEPKAQEFRRIALAGNYGTVSALAQQLGVTRMTAWLWLRKLRAEARAAATKPEAECEAKPK